MYGLLVRGIFALPIMRALEAIIDLKTFSLLGSKLDHSPPMALSGASNDLGIFNEVL